MADMKETRKYVFTVEGETEKMYLCRLGEYQQHGKGETPGFYNS